MTVAPHPVLAGLNGWYRYSPSVASHFYVDGRKQCGIAHGIFVGLGGAPRRPEASELTRHGEPYGRACQPCLKAARRRQSPVQSDKQLKGHEK